MARILSSRIVRSFRWLAVVTIVLAAAGAAALRYWLVPNLDQLRPRIAEELSRTLGVPVTIEELHAEWPGPRPHLRASGATVCDASNRPAVRLQQVEAVLSTWALFSNELRIVSLSIGELVVDVRREASGVVTIAGVPAGQGLDLPQWLLEDAAVRVGDARFNWHDQRPASPELSTVEIRNAQGRLSLEESGGRVRLAAHGVALRLPALFAEPLAADDLILRANWRHDGDIWRIGIEQLSHNSPEAVGEFSGQYHTTAHGPGWVDFRGELQRADARAAWKYIPLVAGQGVRDWLKAALQSGNARKGRFQLTGDLSGFPFAHGGGVFKVSAAARNVSLSYAKGWPSIHQIDGEIVFDGSRMQVTSRRGQSVGTNVVRAVATIPDLTAPNREIDVDGEARGSTSEFLQFLAQSPLHRSLGGLLERAGVVGSSRLQLGLRIPLASVSGAKVKGDLHVSDNRVHLDGVPTMEKAEAHVDFTEHGVTVQDGVAEVFGFPAKINVTTDQSGTTQVAASGSVMLAQLSSLGLSLPETVRGLTDWQASVALRERPGDLTITSTLRGLTIELPSPLGKREEETRPLWLHRTRNEADATRAIWAVRFGSVLTAAAATREAVEGTPTLERGAVRFGGDAPPGLPAGRTLTVEGELDRLDLDSWLPRFRNQDSKNGPLPPLSGINLRVQGLHLGDRDWHDLHVLANREGSHWQAHLLGTEVEGSVDWLSGEHNQVTARMKRVNVPKPSPPVFTGLAAPRERAWILPSMDVGVDRFQYGDLVFGQVRLKARAEGAQAWEIQQLHVNNSDASLVADGAWLAEAPRGQWKANFALNARDVGKLMTRLGSSGISQRGNGRLSGVLGCLGTPFDVDLSTLSGDLTLSAKDGELLKVGNGLAFDQVTATMHALEGVVHTDDARLTSSVATVSMKGDVDVGRETLQLHARVVPVIGDKVAMGLAFAAPPAGLAALLLQRALNDPIGQLAASEYDIVGPWAKPNVVKSGRR
jgi:uncharacterized protein (TIGR02099 family)